MSLLQMSFCGAVIILAVTLIRAVTIDRLPKRTFLVLWGIVLFRLLVPFEIPSAFSVYSFAGDELAEPSIYGNGLADRLVAKDSHLNTLQEIMRKQSSPVLQDLLSDGVASGQCIVQLDDVTDERITVSYKRETSEIETSGRQDTPSGTKTVEQVQKSFTDRTAMILSDAAGRMGRNLWLAVWGMGALLCAVFYTTTYVRCRKEFSMSLPVDNEFVDQWIRRRLSQRYILYRIICKTEVKVSDRVDTPLTYGVFRPVILLPKKIEWEETEQLEYILWHEYMHIYHCDTVLKLLAVVALCIHWFNPFVWLMYFLINRDVELACDESVVRKNGVSGRSLYANMLIGMEARRNGLRPLCNNFSQNAIERRIRAIMKIRKVSVGAIIFAVGLVMSVSLVFATSAVSEQEKNILSNKDVPVEETEKNIPSGTDSSVKETEEIIPSNTDFSVEEYEKLNALRFDGYEDMSVSEYRNSALAAVSTEEYRSLLDDFFGSKTLYEQRNSNETASFLFYVLKPLTSMGWMKMDFNGIVLEENTALEPKETQGLHYNLNLSVLNVNDLTVGEYVGTVHGVTAGLQKILKEMSKEKSVNMEGRKELIAQAVETLAKEWSSYKLKVDIDFIYNPVNLQEDEYSDQEEWVKRKHYNSDISLRFSYAEIKQKSREEPYGTKEDYASLLSLKKPGYEQMSLEEFDREVLNWKVANYESYKRIQNDWLLDDFRVEFSPEDKDFITHTVRMAEVTNSTKAQHPSDDGIGFTVGLVVEHEGEEKRYIWNYMYSAFSYYATDMNTVTVGERDRCVGGMMDAIEQFWNETATEDFINMKNGDFDAKLHKLAEEYSSNNISISLIAASYSLGWGWERPLWSDM